MDTSSGLRVNLYVQGSTGLIPQEDVVSALRVSYALQVDIRICMYNVGNAPVIGIIPLALVMQCLVYLLIHVQRLSIVLYLVESAIKSSEAYWRTLHTFNCLLFTST